MGNAIKFTEQGEVGVEVRRETTDYLARLSRNHKGKTLLPGRRVRVSTNPKEGDEDGEKSWQRLRTGVANIHRRADISQAGNDRYVEATVRAVIFNSLPSER